MASAASAAAFAPGRVNLIGEHTDYEEGLCLPFAIEQGVTVRARPTGGGEIVARALDLGEEDRFPPGASLEPGEGWRPFVRGTVAELGRAGAEVPPLELEISGEVPRGAGLSSSAALGVALALAVGAAAGEDERDAAWVARLCSRVENDWVGARTGLLDQLASLHGLEGHATLLDMREPERARPVPLELAGHALVTIDSGASRELGPSGYNRRREECREAADRLDLPALRDAAPEDAERLPEPLSRRVRHVASENARVGEMTDALAGGDLRRAGELLCASHRSLRDDFEASVPEVERTVDAALAAGALGARMVGGGFGGHVLALFPPGAEPPPGATAVAPGPGARLL